MQNKNNLSSNLTAAEHELELALAGLAPASPSALNLRRDELMFMAGARSAHRTLRIWQSTAAMLAICSGLSVFVRVESANKVLIVRSPTSQSTVEPVVATSTPIRSPYSLASLRNAVQEGGVDAMPTHVHPPDGDGSRVREPAKRLPTILNPQFGEPL